MQAQTRREARLLPTQTYVQGEANSAWTHFQDDVIVDRNAVRHGNIHRQVHVPNSAE